MKFLKWRLPFFLWTLIILFLTWYPKVEIPDLGINAEDKVAHIAVFLLWGILMLRMLNRYEINDLSGAVKLVIVSGTLFAIVDESIQGLIPGRYFTFYDMLANAAGVWLSPLIFRFILLPFTQRFSHQQD